MSGLTDYGENKVIDALLRGQALGVPATWYVALFTADPTDTGSLSNELTGGGYARVGVVASMANFAGTQGAGTTTASTGTSGLTSNNILITYPTPSGDWPGPITHWGLCDASTAGNVWLTGALDAADTVYGGDIAPYFAAEQIAISLD